MPVEGVEWDHVAVAVWSWADGWRRYVGDLGARWRNGGRAVGFAASLFDFASGAKLEILEPNAVDEHDFLQRFLERHGEGPHHLTFRVPDVAAAHDQVLASGRRVVGAHLDDPVWRELFVHPEDSPGILVQLASPGPEYREAAAPAALPRPARETADLLRVTLAVPDLDAAIALFVGLLGGDVTPVGVPGHGTAAVQGVDVSWAGRSLRLLSPLDPEGTLAGSLRGRRGRFESIAFSLDDPWGVPDAHPGDDGDGCWRVAAGDNLGVALELHRR